MVPKCKHIPKHRACVQTMKDTHTLAADMKTFSVAVHVSLVNATGSVSPRHSVCGESFVCQRKI